MGKMNRLKQNPPEWIGSSLDQFQTPREREQEEESNAKRRTTEDQSTPDDRHHQGLSLSGSFFISLIYRVFFSYSIRVRVNRTKSTKKKKIERRRRERFELGNPFESSCWPFWSLSCVQHGNHGMLKLLGRNIYVSWIPDARFGLLNSCVSNAQDTFNTKILHSTLSWCWACGFIFLMHQPE